MHAPIYGGVSCFVDVFIGLLAKAPARTLVYDRKDTKRVIYTLVNYLYIWAWHMIVNLRATCTRQNISTYSYSPLLFDTLWLVV